MSCVLSAYQLCKSYLLNQIITMVRIVTVTVHVCHSYFISFKGNRDDTTTRSNIELSEFMQSIEEQFSDILVPSEKITKQYLLGKGMS